MAGMTLAAWSCLLLPLYKNSVAHLSYFSKISLIAFPIFAMGLYLLFGNSHQLQQFWFWQRQNAEVQEQVAAIKNPQQLIDQLQAHLQQDPQSAEGWRLLGRLYLDQRQYAHAESALTQAHRLQPKNSETVLALAKANFFNHHGHLTPSMEKQLGDVLESLAGSVDALNLLAVNAYRKKDFRKAVSYWQRALSLVQLNSPDSRALLDMISQAQHQEQGIENGSNN